MEYYKVYIQKMGTDQQGNPFPVKETIADFGIPGTNDEGAYASEFPFKPFGDTKELPSNNWFDEHGKDPYIPKHLFFKSYETTLKFSCKGKTSAYAKKTVNSFVRYLAGLDGTGATFMIYDTYNNIGRGNVRFVSLESGATLYKDEDGEILVFSIKVEINDPVTDYTLDIDQSGNVVGIIGDGNIISPYYQATKWLVYPKGVPSSDIPTVQGDRLVFGHNANVRLVTTGEGENRKTTLVIS